MDNWRKKSKKYDAHLIMIGVAYIKMLECRDEDRKHSYKELLNYLIEETKKI